MLIRNKSRVENIIHAELEFDDGTVKAGTIRKGDKAHLKFRYDGRVVQEFGRIEDIIFGYNFKLSRKDKMSTLIVFDASHDLMSREYKIDMNDLIDFEIVPDFGAIGPNKGKISMRVAAPIKHHHCGKVWKAHDEERKRSCRKACI